MQDFVTNASLESLECGSKLNYKHKNSEMILCWLNFIDVADKAQIFEEK